MEIEIKKLSEKTLKDFLFFFDELAFCDNPEWAGCYCYFYYIADNDQWFRRTKEQNRKDAEKSILAGKMNGYLAYHNDKPVGWCNADDFNSYSRLINNPDIIRIPNEKAGAVTCFLIEKNYRRKGIAGTLLQYLTNDFIKRNYDFIEAYPLKEGKTEADYYHGPLSLYLTYGFEIFQELEDLYIVRKNLQK